MQSPLQNPKWAEFKKDLGWEIFEINKTFVLGRKLPYINQKMLYVPEYSVSNSDDLTALIPELTKLAHQQKAFFVRLEIFELATGEKSQAILNILKQSGFVKSFEEVQPEWRQIINLNLSETELLAQMKPKGRYNIKIARENGVAITHCSGNNEQAGEMINRFHKLYSTTSQRHDFSGRGQDYFLKLAKHLGDKIEIFVASQNNQDLAGLILLLENDMALYLYGGSNSVNSAIMAPYLLHFEAMLWAKNQGAKIYDLIQISPQNDSGAKHTYDGITQFKTRFGGQSIQLIGSYDLILKPIWYRIFSLLEKSRRKK